MDELGRMSVAEFKEAKKNPIVVVLDNIRSMHNVGSVFRTSDAFRIEAICLCGYSPQPPHRDIQKTALGATETVNWIYFEHTKDAIQQLKAHGYSIFASNTKSFVAVAAVIGLQNQTVGRAAELGNEITFLATS